ncbi:unnamed protein product, partial [Symbiodinium microadriaticum]
VGSWVEAALEERNYADEVQTTTKILKDQKVKGTALLDLTYDRLVNQPYNIAAGPASQLAKRIAALAAPAAAASGFQANTVQSVIEEKDLAQLSEVSVPSATVRKGQALAGIEECIKACMSLVQKYIKESDETGLNRVPPTCAARCARGGKTTFLQKLGEALAGAGYFPIFTSFNGESPVKRRENEPADQWLYRTIAYALLPSDSSLRQDLAREFGKVTCEKSTLVTYFNSKEKVVLLVDELNQLLLKSDDEAEKNAEQRASRFMKDVFLGVRGRYMVFTSHIQSTGLDLTQYMEGTSSRGLAVTGLPRVACLEHLQHMSRDFSGLTHMRAAYYSRVPALIWTSHHSPDLLRQKFAQIHEDPNSHLSAFLAELFTGTRMADMKAFQQLTDGSIRAEKTVWIPCFMSHFLFQCQRDWPACAVLSEWLHGMRDAEAQDGKAWEKIIAVAFGLRYIWSRIGGEHHRWLHGHGEASIECLDAKPTATSVDEAVRMLPQPQKYPTLQLVLPKHSKFKAIDLFAVRREKGVKAKLVMVAQQKEGSSRKRTNPPPKKAEHAYWMRGSSTLTGKATGTWYQPSQSEMDEFLGPSLAAAAPATWTLLLMPLSLVSLARLAIYEIDVVMPPKDYIAQVLETFPSPSSKQRRQRGLRLDLGPAGCDSMESRKIIKSSEVSCGRLGAQAAHTQNREQGGGLNLRITLCLKRVDADKDDDDDYEAKDLFQQSDQGGLFLLAKQSCQ